MEDDNLRLKTRKKLWTKDDLKPCMIFKYRECINYTYKITTLWREKMEIIDSDGITSNWSYASVLQDINDGYDIYLPMYDTKLGKYLAELSAGSIHDNF